MAAVAGLHRAAELRRARASHRRDAGGLPRVKPQQEHLMPQRSTNASGDAPPPGFRR